MCQAAWLVIQPLAAMQVPQASVWGAATKAELMTSLRRWSSATRAEPLGRQDAVRLPWIC